jgi:response regulator NasT
MNAQKTLEAAAPPCASHSPKGAASVAEPTGDPTKPRLLLVDDDRLILATLSDGLLSAGYEVVTAASAAEALAHVSKDQFDLAVLDIRMPGMDGIELGRRLREHTSVPFVYLSAYGDTELVRDATEHGALGYLLKPLDIPQIVPTIEAALARAREIAGLKDSEGRLSTALTVEQKTRMAVGVLMERLKLERQAAFELLRQRARSERRKVIEVADEILAAVEMLNFQPPREHKERP